jgi:cardiolipin synthase
MSIASRPDPCALTIPTVLLTGGEAAFARILARIEGARRTVVLRCFGWRDDATGQIMARSLMAAADRRVQVSVLKDLVGATYEYLEGTHQSFLHKPVDRRTWLAVRGLMTAYGGHVRLTARPNPLADALLAHPNITVERDRRRRDHSKVYVIDDEILFIGGIGIDDDARCANVDFMIEITGAEHAARYHARVAGDTPFDAARPLDFLVHTVAVQGRRHCPLLAERVRLIDAARTRITIAMAYLGDPRITDPLVRAVRRGVAVTIVTGARTNVIGDLNLATCNELLRRTGAPPHLHIALHPRTVHAKAMVIDRSIVDLGSANFTPLSHGVYDEVDVYVQDPVFAGKVEDAVERHAGEGRPVGARVPFNRVYAVLERAVVARQAQWATP